MGQPRPGALPSPVFSSRDFFTKNPRTVRIVVLSLIAAVLVALGLFAVEIPHTYSFQMNGPEFTQDLPVFANHSFPDGSDVGGSWSTGCAAYPEFAITIGYDPTNWSRVSEVFAEAASSGQFAFHSNGALYTFEFYCDEVNYTVSVSGTYSMPLL